MRVGRVVGLVGLVRHVRQNSRLRFCEKNGLYGLHSVKFSYFCTILPEIV